MQKNHDEVFHVLSQLDQPRGMFSPVIVELTTFQQLHLYEYSLQSSICDHVKLQKEPLAQMFIFRLTGSDFINPSTLLRLDRVRSSSYRNITFHSTLKVDFLLVEIAVISKCIALFFLHSARHFLMTLFFLQHDVVVLNFFFWMNLPVAFMYSSL